MRVEVLKMENIPVPIHLHIERRNNSRATILKDKIIIRLPIHLSSTQLEESKNKMLQWAVKKVSVKELFLPPAQERFINNAQVEIYNDVWTVQVNHHLPKVIQLRLEYPYIKMLYPEGTKVSKQMSSLMSKAFSKYYLTSLYNEVHQINKDFFKEDLGKISLKYTNTRWGSCSNKRNLNFSTRLLLVPAMVRRYVIIHELAHLREMNHSERFWKIVEQAMPDYLVYDKWLTKNGRQYDF
jgi:predicted metal-dependent hydrolase